eukprot:jgi/Ulvmu1/10515/UM064_0053.1
MQIVSCLFPQSLVSYQPSRAGTIRPIVCNAHSCDQLHSTACMKRRKLLHGLAGIGILFSIAPGSALAGPLGEESYRKASAIKRVVKLFLQEEYSKLEAITSPDAFVYFQSPSTLPYSGKYVGYDCVRQFMGRFNDNFIIISTPEVYQYLNESGSVFAAFDFLLKSVATGKEFQTSMTMKIKVNDDLQLTKIAIIGDTLAQYEALQ